jgi:2-polyprenyl-3-methyl-5-hydroxy-6-metoxy-1,4-benzoquinol methylase
MLKALVRRLFPGSMQNGAGARAGKEQSADFYDKRFASKSRWREHYTKSRYYPVWTVVADRLKRARVARVVDIGCGPGQFACVLRDQGIEHYVGLDFSPLRLEHARKICPEYTFQQTDIFQSDFLSTHDYDAVVLLEFLEHVERDLEALSRIKPGTLVIATVPNFTDRGHVRFFEKADAVLERYGAVLPDLTVATFRSDDAGKLFFLIEGHRG